MPCNRMVMVPLNYTIMYCLRNTCRINRLVMKNDFQLPDFPCEEMMSTQGGSSDVIVVKEFE